MRCRLNNEIFLKRKNKLFIDKGNNTEYNEQYIITFLKNIESLGYTFSKNIVDILKTKSIDEINKIYIDTLLVIRKMIGANVKYKPMYPNFPLQVMEMEYTELYLNAMIHYWSDGIILPKYKKDKRMPLFDTNKVKVIELGTEEEFYNIFYNIMNSKTSISEEDKKDLIWFFKNDINYYKYIPEEITMKENIALIAKLIIENAPIISIKPIEKYFNTATDVLRLATAMSNGDISLSENTKFRSFKRKERRLILQLLENCNNIKEDMFKYKNRWIRLGERIHPFEYKNYSNSKIAFYAIRNNEKIETFNSSVTKTIENGYLNEALKLLKTRPGEFARKLDYILRISYGEEDLIINEFKSISKEISTSVLLQVREHFLLRNYNNSEIRVFFPKGKLSKYYIIKNNLLNIEIKYCLKIVDICSSTLIEKYREKDYIGNIFVSTKLKDYLIPFSQRSASNCLKTIVRGSKISYNINKSVLRLFVWWKNNEYRTDIDLSVEAFDENWNYVTHVSYTYLKDDKLEIYHSGDIVDAPKGASEFIDINLSKVIDKKVRYIVVCVFCFTGQHFSDLPECFMGWMERTGVFSGEIFEPKTVINKMDISSTSRMCVPMIVDIYNNQIIWCDMPIKKTNFHIPNNIENNQYSISSVCRAMTEMKKPNIYELIKLHISARGKEVFDKEDADIIFDVENDDYIIKDNQKLITPFDIDVLSSEYI